MFQTKVVEKTKYTFNFHSHTVHLDTIKVFYLPIDAQ